MKKIYLTLITILIIHIANGQNTPWSTTGNIGIGTTTPNSTLNVDPQGAGGIFIGNSNGGSGGFTSLQFNISAKQNGYSWLQSTQSSGSLYGNLNLNPLGGYVGIGTITPQEPLSVVAATSTSLGLYRSITGGNPNLGAAVGQINFGAFNATSSTELFGSQVLGMATENWTPGSAQGSAIVFRTTANTTTSLTEAMRIDNNGSLLIGKTSSTYKFDVAGSARANSITVNTTGADFVFEPTYKLFPLSEIEKYIEANHHLPEIPSAKEMQTNGLNVGDNQIKLLQKVEELTLYLIEKDRENKELKQSLEGQQSTLDAQKQQLLDQGQRIKVLEEKLDELLKPNH